MTYNASEYNQATYNAMQTFLATTLTDDIIFNWLWLQNANIVTSFKNDDNLPAIDLIRYQNPIVDGGGVLRKRYTNKQIVLRWKLKADTEAELNNIIDVFKQKTSVVDWFLDIKTNWIYRRTKATVVSNNIMDRKNFNLTFVPFEITFETLDPFFYNKDAETITDTNITGDHLMEFTYYWTAPSQPRVYFVFATGGWTDEMIFELNDRKLTVNHTMLDGDILLFDSVEKTVKINWTEVDYTWTFPTLIYGDNLFQYTINWSPLLDITILYTTNFL